MTVSRSPILDFPDLFPDGLPRAERDWSFDVGPGWRPALIRALHGFRVVAAEEKQPIHVLDVREVFGQLTFKLSRTSEDLLLVTLLARMDSSRTCPACGTPSKRRVIARRKVRRLRGLPTA